MMNRKVALAMYPPLLQAATAGVAIWGAWRRSSTMTGIGAIGFAAATLYAHFAFRTHAIILSEIATWPEVQPRLRAQGGMRGMSGLVLGADEGARQGAAPAYGGATLG